jgi:hypothetical protein
VDGGRTQWAQVVESPDCLDAGRHDQAVLYVYDPWPESGQAVAAIVAPRAAPGPGADLDGGGQPEVLGACRATDGVRVRLTGPGGTTRHEVTIAGPGSAFPACGE